MVVGVDSPLWVGWSLSLYPDAGEGGASFVRPPSGLQRRGCDPERVRAEAARRARAKVRRYCAANRLNRLGTLTYRGAGCHDPRVFRCDIAEFFRALRDLLSGAAFPYVWTAEWHKSGHGLHAHFAVGQYINRSLIERAWGRGFVHIKLLGDLPVGSGVLAEARKAAGYLSKYVSKDFDAKRAAGLHRYDVAQGFQPQPVRIRDRSAARVLAAASERMGRPPALLRRSQDIDGYDGPPWVWAQWA